MASRLLLVAAAVALPSSSSAAFPASGALGDLATISCDGGSTCAITANVGASTDTVPLRLQFYAPQVVRWWLQLDGNFSDIGMAADVIVGTPANLSLSLRDGGAFWEVSQVDPAPPPAPAVAVRVNKSPVLLSVLVNGQAVVQETSPLAWNATSSWQTLARDAAPFAPGLSSEAFLGGGMQNGAWSHRDTTITIAVDYNWALGGHPNSVPLFLSTAGYGAMRNTWAPGTYSFSAPVVAAHNESNRLDAFLMVAAPGDLKALLGLYTALTGPPFLPPIYGLFLGDSDCYHNDRHGNSTQVAIAVAQAYVDNDMPRGWMLVNDGYGCGYGEPNDGAFPSNITDLAFVVAQLHQRGIYTGLWTSTGMPNIAKEVGFAGTRVAKTDVGWIGDGYEYAFDGVTLCADGIEQYSSPPARRFVWTVEGWAGTHRLAVMWTGDDVGSMDYVKWQIPTFIGCGFSAQAHVSGDIDGIFGGSPESQVRDLQFKAFTTTIMSMSGWADNPDKQPWAWQEPYTSYNRASLKLKARLTPYLYSLSRVAYDTGVPPIRAMALEFPTDPALYVPSNGTSYSFMSGPSLLVAPVYEQGAVSRDDIYLPAGAQWVDWASGALYEGGQTLDGYPAPLSTIPVFVRAGAIIPMWAPVNFFNESAHDPMYLELWPSGNSSFELYEDDGITRAALPPTSAWGRTDIAVSAPAAYLNASAAAANVTVSVAAVRGSFAGQLASRVWWLNIRSRSAPLDVILTMAADGAQSALPQMQSIAELEYEPSGWYFDDTQQGGLVMVKTPSLAATSGWSITLSNGPSYPHIGTETCDVPTHRQVEEQRFAFDAASGTFGVANASLQCITVGADKDPDSHAPAVEVQACDPALASRQQFTPLPSGQIALKADSSQCLDQDMSDLRVIVYGCHDPSTPGNQAWTIDPVTQHLISRANGLCMAVFPPA